MNKRDNAKSVALGATDGGQQGKPESSHATESEEWAWMVDEDPAFYLEETAPEKRGG